MISAVFDCNIFLQALLNPNGIAAKCFEAVKAGKLRLFISRDTLEEVRNVLLRPNILAKLPDATPEQIRVFIEDVAVNSTFEKNVRKSFKFDRDPKDEMILDLALACKADFIVSRDRDLLDLMTDISAAGKEFRQKSRPLKIVEPIEFLNTIAREISL